jgi:protein TonB
LATYSLAAPYAHTPLRRRAAGLALGIAINIGLILMLMTLGIVPVTSAQKSLRGIIVDLIPSNQAPSRARKEKVEIQHPRTEAERPVPKTPPIILPVKPTIAPPPQPSNRPSPWLELSKDEMAASDISKLASSGSGSAGDSAIVGRGPNGEALYAAEWAREPTHAELDGYLPHNAIDGFGLIECKTIANDRVEDCIELDQTPGSHLASAVRQAAWQFRVRPPRRGGRVLIGSWVRIRIDYYSESGPNEDDQTR